MGNSSVNPYARIRQLEAQICCLKKEGLTSFFSANIVDPDDIDFSSALDAFVRTGDGSGNFQIGAGIPNAIYADLAAVAAALNAYYTAAFGTFTVVGDTIKLVTVDSYEDLDVIVTN